MTHDVAVPALRADRLGKRYGRQWGLRDCTFEVPAGSVVGLVGPNGAGKTTLLALTVGLLGPSKATSWTTCRTCSSLTRPGRARAATGA